MKILMTNNVLIETYWNVNEGHNRDICITGSINRNILECKWTCSAGMGEDADCINRNILECKCIWFAGLMQLHGVLIETYWNVNEEKYKLLDDDEASINRNILECK